MLTGAAQAASRDPLFIRDYHGLNVPATGVYFGADDPKGGFTGPSGIETKLNHTVAIHNRHYSHGASTDTIAANAAADAASGHVPMISLGGQGYTGSTLAGIAAGNEDAYWSGLAAKLAAINSPIIFRPWMEMNGAHNAYSNSTADYIAAWRHLHDLFSGATNLIWVFCPQQTTTPGLAPWSSYWPGDDVVDWMGLDLYRHVIGAAQPFIDFGRAHGMPTIIAESGFQQGAKVKDPADGKLYDKDGSVTGRSLIRNTENNLAAHPSIVAYLSWNAIGPMGDDRIDTSPAGLDQYRTFAADPWMQLSVMPTPPPPPPVTMIKHVVLIVEENKAYTATVGHMPYLDSLRTQYAQATDYWATNYPSLPNYQRLTSGVSVPTKDCAPSASCQSTQDNIFHQLAGNWSVWAESMPKPCYKSNTTSYVPRHTAAPYYTDLSAECATHDIVLPASPVISSAFTLVAPNMVDDMHNGTLTQGDAWLKGFVPKLLADPSYQDGSTLIEITFDSGSSNCGANCASHVEAVFINPALAGVTVSTHATHDSMLRLNEELLGLPLLGGAATAPDIRPDLGL